MDVLLVYANTYHMLAAPPVGLSLLTGPLRRAGHTVRVVDLMKEPDPDAALARALGAARVDLVGFSMRNLDNFDYRDGRDFVPDYVRWVGLANRVAPTIIGGSAVIAVPEPLLERTGATYALAGEGVQAFPAFLAELESGRTGGFQADGLVWREDGVVRSNPGRFDGYAGDGSIDWSVIDHRRYRGGYNNCCVITKTGCPYQCAFCDAPATFGDHFMPREPEAIVEDLRRDARERGFHRFDYFFIDGVFNEPADWTKRVLEALTRFEHRIIFSAVCEPTAHVDREMTDLLRRAGCGMVTSLVGSMDDHVLAQARRPFRTGDVHRAFEHLEASGVPYMPQLLLGGPGETRQTVLGNLEHLRRRRPVFTWASYGLRVLPLAGLRDVAVAEGVVDADDDLLTPRYYLSEALRGDEAWLDAQLRKINRFHLAALPQMARYMARTVAVRFQR